MKSWQPRSGGSLGTGAALHRRTRGLLARPRVALWLRAVVRWRAFLGSVVIAGTLLRARALLPLRLLGSRAAIHVRTMALGTLGLRVMEIASALTMVLGLGAVTLIAARTAEVLRAAWSLLRAGAAIHVGTWSAVVATGTIELRTMVGAATELALAERTALVAARSVETRTVALRGLGTEVAEFALAVAALIAAEAMLHPALAHFLEGEAAMVLITSHARALATILRAWTLGGVALSTTGLTGAVLLVAGAALLRAGAASLIVRSMIAVAWAVGCRRLVATTRWLGIALWTARLIAVVALCVTLRAGVAALMVAVAAMRFGMLAWFATLRAVGLRTRLIATRTIAVAALAVALWAGFAGLLAFRAAALGFGGGLAGLLGWLGGWRSRRRCAGLGGGILRPGALGAEDEAAGGEEGGDESWLHEFGLGGFRWSGGL